jgi:hypothetical protein
VEIRPELDGIVEDIRFREGQPVKQGHWLSSLSSIRSFEGRGRPTRPMRLQQPLATGRRREECGFVRRIGNPSYFLLVPKLCWGTYALGARLPVLRSRASRTWVPKPELGNQVSCVGEVR